MPAFEPGVNCKTRVDALTNSFPMEIKLPKELYRYEVDVKVIRPKKKDLKKKDGQEEQAGNVREATVNRDLLKKIMGILLARLYKGWKDNKKVKIGIIHDFSRILISSKNLNGAVPLEYKILHSELLGEDDDDCYYDVKINHADFNVNLESLEVLFKGLRMKDQPQLAELKQIYNVLMKNIGNDSYVTIGRSSLMKLSEPNEYNYLGWGMKNLKGVSAICTLGATWKPFLNIEIQNSAYLINQNVIETISEVFANGDWKNPVTFNNPQVDMYKATNVEKWAPRDFADVESILRCKSFVPLLYDF
jgi:hypothetical protein